MYRRIFIGIDLPEDAKKSLNRKIEKWKTLPVKWSLPDNLHVTLLFLGFVDDSNLFDICSSLKSVAFCFESFDIDFESINFVPDKENPKFIWLRGDANENLHRLQTGIEKSLDIFVREKNEFFPHITLGRIDRAKWKILSEKPKIEENFKISIPVESFQIFESRIEKGRRKFDILENYKLK